MTLGTQSGAPNSSGRRLKGGVYDAVELAVASSKNLKDCVMCSALLCAQLRPSAFHPLARWVPDAAEPEAPVLRQPGIAFTRSMGGGLAHRHWCARGKDLLSGTGGRSERPKWSSGAVAISALDVPAIVALNAPTNKLRTFPYRNEGVAPSFNPLQGDCPRCCSFLHFQRVSLLQFRLVERRVVVIDRASLADAGDHACSPFAAPSCHGQCEAKCPRCTSGQPRDPCIK
jgi:hypothetical protein